MQVIQNSQIYVWEPANTLMYIQGPVQTLCVHSAKAEWACLVAVIGRGCSVGALAS